MFPNYGFAGGMPLAPQPTGFVDPRLQLMSSYLMPPSAMSSPFTATPTGMPSMVPPQQQFGGLSLQQSFQQHNQQTGMSARPNLSWALNKAEKKSYDQLFRQWDAQGTGFISGQTALEVFGQSGLDRNDLAKIWSLADADNRGKLNLAEFHVAMGIIYRRLNGAQIPDELPPELVPPSSRDLDTSVNFLKDILKNDTRARSPSGFDLPVSRLKERSFTSPSTAFLQQGGRQDATVYKHEDIASPDSVYHPRSRHVDRHAVRSRVDDASPASSDLASLKRQLLNTQKMLDDTLSSERESDQLDQDLEDLRYRIKRLQDELEYVSRGPRTVTKDEDRRRLERQLVQLMHEDVPVLERKVEEREARREREKREWTRDRDRRNERFGRFANEDDDRYSPAHTARYRSEEERPYSRGASRYDQDRSRDRERSYWDGDRDREHDRERRVDKDTRSPPPAPAPAAPSARVITPPAAAPTTSRSPVAQLKSMSTEERQAYIRAQAERRIQARKQALGVTAIPSTPASPSTLDPSVEDRLAQEKREAEEKAHEAERLAGERERLRQERLVAEKALTERKSPNPPPTPTSTAPPPTPAVASPPVKVTPASATVSTHESRPAPTVRKSRAPAPPPPKRDRISHAPPAVVSTPPVTSSASALSPPGRNAPPRTPTLTAVSTPPVSSPAPPPPAPHVGPLAPNQDELDIQRREQELLRKRQERMARLRQLEEEEEAEAKRAEEEYKQRRQQFLAAKAKVASGASALVQDSPASPPVPRSPPPPSPPPAPAPLAVTPKVPAVRVEVPAPPPPPAPPASAPPADKPSNNPFNRLMKGGNRPTPPATGAQLSPRTEGRPNPFFRPQTTPPAAAVPTPPKSPSIPAPPPPNSLSVSAPEPPRSSSVPPPIRTPYHTAPASSDDDWDDVVEKNEDDSSDEELATRDTRLGLAQQLFKSLVPARPSSTGPASSRSPPPSTPSLAAPPAPPAPPPPPPPQAPPAPSAISEPSFAPPALAPPAPPPPPAPPAPSSSALPSPGLPTAIAAPAGDRSALLGAIKGGARLRKTVTNDRSGVIGGGTVREDSPPPVSVSVPRMEPVSAAPSPPAVMISPPSALALHVPPPDVSPSTTSGHRPNESVDWYNELAADHAGKDSIEPLPLTKEEEEEKEDYVAVDLGTEDAVQSVDNMEDIDTSTLLRVWSLYPYEAERSEDLGFEANVIIEAHPSKSDSEWWYGKSVKDGNSGLFPRAYVQETEQVRATALYSYSGSTSEEMSFTEGDKLIVIDRSDADWWKVESDGVVYVVPAAYVEVAEAPGVEGRPDLKSGRIESECDMTTDADVYSVQSGDDEDYYSMDDGADAANGDGNGGVTLATGPPFDAPTSTPAPTLTSTSTLISTLEIAHNATHTHKALPPVPKIDLPDGGEVDDAFGRYDTFRKMHGEAAAKRLSAASSLDSASLVSVSPACSHSESLVEREREREQDKVAGGETRTSQFLSFLSRHARLSIPDNEHERKLAAISGPIHTPVSASGTAGDSREFIQDSGGVAFGSSWASLLDPAALESIPKVERRRQEAIFELISTEADYVRNLQLIVELFYSRLVKTLGEKTTDVVFSNIEDILLMNTAFLSTLEERQRDCRLYIDHIGDLLENHMPNMQTYLEYCVNQAHAGTVLKSTRDSNPELAVQLQHLREDPAARNLDLSSYLLAPMQRLTRYPLLIRQILQYTDPPPETRDPESAPRLTLALPSDDRERKSIANALACAERILAEVNETIREREGVARLAEVSKVLWIGRERLDLTQATHHLGPRRLVKEGPMVKARSGRRLRLLLCNDILVLLDENAAGLYCAPLPVHELEMRASQRETDTTVRIHRAYPRGGKMLVLRAETSREARAWVEAIGDTTARARAVNSAAVAVGGDST